MATKKKPAKKAIAKKAPAEKAVAKKAVAKKASVKKAVAKKPSAKESPQKQSAAKKAPVKKAADKASKPVKSPFGQKFIDAQEQNLLRERARYMKSAETWKAEADSLLVDREPGDVQFDEESGDGDTLQVERERDLALSGHAEAAVEEIDEALARLKAGTYGVCITSGKPIPKERLEAIPWAAERVEYKVAGFRR